MCFLMVSFGPALGLPLIPSPKHFAALSSLSYAQSEIGGGREREHPSWSSLLLSPCPVHKQRCSVTPFARQHCLLDLACYPPREIHPPLRPPALLPLKPTILDSMCPHPENP
ncbi:unnamed protein product [Linum trigynum]|uniref:Secreted protein n=1 Tax=Linum trigynum TaxID=586398 RepID=A0AAV2CVZ2_9ROSI